MDVALKITLVLILVVAVTGCGTVSKDVEGTALAQAGYSKVHIKPHLDGAGKFVGNEYLYLSGKDTEGLSVDLEPGEDGTLKKLKVRVDRSNASKVLEVVAPALVEIRATLAARDAKLAEELMPAIEALILRTALGAATGGVGAALVPR